MFKQNITKDRPEKDDNKRNRYRPVLIRWE